MDYSMIEVLQETTKWEGNVSNGIYHVNEAGNTYTIEDGKCSCPGFVYRNDCKHVKELV